MKEEIYNEQQLKALEEEIRALGIPYSENEPDERYFANFRVRLNERIEEESGKQHLSAKIWTWLVASPIRYLSLGAGLAGVIIAALLLQPTSEPEVAVLQVVPQKIEAPSEAPAVSNEIKKEIKPELAASVKTHERAAKVVNSANIATHETRNSVLNDADLAADFASMDASLSGSGAESDDPVNLEKLSESELESVIAVAEDMK